MPVNKEAYQKIISELRSKNVTLVAVSKTKSVSAIQELYELGQRDFGENYVQELAEKQSQLPVDIHWNFIGHLQSNKVKYIAPFVKLIQSVDSFNLLKEINKQGEKNKRIIDCLLQVHIAQEETKFGLDEKELNDLMRQYSNSTMNNLKILGLMGMASLTNDTNKIGNEFNCLRVLFEKYSKFQILSMGMSSDYKIAIDEGSNMVRIGSLIFGEREKNL